MHFNDYSAQVEDKAGFLIVYTYFHTYVLRSTFENYVIYNLSYIM